MKHLCLLLLCLPLLLNAQLRLVKDNQIQNPPSGATPVASVNGWLIFTGSATDVGNELWASNGQPGSSPTLLRDFEPGIWSSDFEQLTVFEHELYFIRQNHLHTRWEVWKTDGTPTGTQHLFDQGLPISLMGVLPGAVLFGNQPPTTVSRTLLAYQTASGTFDTLTTSYGGSLTCLKDKAYFGGELPGIGRELLQSDGTQAGTSLLMEINPGLSGSEPVGFSAHHGRIFFHAQDAPFGKEWWTSDGTPAGTRMIWDGAPGNKSSDLWKIYPVNGHYYVSLVGQMGDQRLVSWDAAADTTAVLTISNNYPISNFFTGPDKKLIIAVSFGTGSTHYETDGTPAGTGICRPLDSLLHNVPNASAWANDSVMYVFGYQYNGQPGTGHFPVFVRWDGAATATHEEWKLPGEALLHQRTLFYHNGELWRTDGPIASNTLVHDLPNTPRGDGVGDYICQLNERTVLFQGRENPQEGWELYRTDGTAPGTYLVKTIAPGVASANIEMMQQIGNQVYFSAYAEPYGQELWVTDGSEAGTHLVADLMPGPANSHPRKVWQSGDRLICEGWPNMADTLLYWLIDPDHPDQAVGLHDLIPGYRGGSLTQPVSLNGQYYLLDGQVNAPHTFWQTDGTTAGTRPLAAYPQDQYPNLLLSGTDALYCWGTPIGIQSSTSVTAFSPATGQWSPVFQVPSQSKISSETDVALLPSGAVFMTKQGNVLTFRHFAPNGQTSVLLQDTLPPSVTYISPDWQTANEVAYCNVQYGVLLTDGTAGGTVLIPWRYHGQPMQIGRIRVVDETIWCYEGKNVYQLDTGADTLIFDPTQQVNSGYPLPAGNLFTNNQDYGTEWWISQPSDTLPTLVKDLYPFETDAFIQDLFIHSISDSVVVVRDQQNMLWQATVSDTGAVPLGITNAAFYPYGFSNHLVLQDRVLVWDAQHQEQGQLLANGPDRQLVPLTEATIKYYGQNIFSLNNKSFWIEGNTVTHTLNLWETDGTPANTRITHSLGAYEQFTTYWGWKPNQNKTEALILTRISGSPGETLWRTDGTAAGTRQVASLDFGPLGHAVQVCTFGDHLVIETINDSINFGYVLLTDSLGQHPEALLGAAKYQTPDKFYVIGDSVFFFTTSPDTQGIMRCTLWAAGENSLLANPVFHFSEGIDPIWIRANDSLLWFNFGEYGPLWRSDGSPQGTVAIQQENVAFNPNLNKAVIAGNMLIVNGFTEENKAVLWGATANSDQLQPLPGSHAPDLPFEGGATTLVRNQLFFGGRGSALYAYDLPTLETLPGERTYTLPDVRGSQWQYAFQDGYTVAAIHPQGLDLGTVTFRMDDRTNVQEVDGHAFAPRHYAISCSGGPDCPADGDLPRDVRLQLYFMDAELDALNAVTGGSNGMRTVDMVHYNGLTNDCDLSNNPLPGYTDRIASDSMMAYDWWSGFYLEFKTRSLGEFALSDHDVTVAKTPYLLWPNPGRDELNVYAIISEIVSIEVFDITGRRLITVDPIQAKSFTLNTEPLQAGVYHIRIRTREYGQVTARWVKY